MTNIETKCGAKMSAPVFDNYLRNLVNKFFKILPLRENEEKTLASYMVSLQREMMGVYSFVVMPECDPMFVSLIAILQYLIDNPESAVTAYRQEVFKSISICNKLRSLCAEAGLNEKEAETE